MHRERTADIAVIIPTASSPRLLENALRSVASQTLPPKEVVVVSDNPTLIDETRCVVEEFRCYPWIASVLCTRGSMGPSYARNIGALEASARYLAFLDDDDEFFAQKFAVINPRLRQADLICHAVRWVVDGGRLEFIQRPGKPRLPDLLIDNTIGTPTAVVVDRNMFVSAGGFREDLPALEDYELWLRLVVRGARVEVLHNELAVYSVRLQSGSRSSRTEHDATAWAMIHATYAEEYLQLSARERARHRQAIFKARMHRNRSAGRRWSASGWAVMAAFSYPSPYSIRLLANALMLPIFRFGSREFLMWVRLASRPISALTRALNGEGKRLEK